MAETAKLDLGEEKASGGSKKKLIFIIIGVLLVVAIGAGAALYFLGIFPHKDKGKAAAKGGEHAATASAEHGAKDAEGEGREAEGEGEEGDEEHAKDEEGKEGHEPEIVYAELKPDFVVNFKNNPAARIAQISLSAAMTDATMGDNLKKHAPMIRNNLLLLIGSEDPAVLKTAEGKEALRKKIFDEINAIIKKQTKKKKGIDEIYFTSFVMQ